MASAEQLKALLKSYIDKDEDHFFSIAMQVAAHEAKLGHCKVAEEIRAMIDAAKSHRSTENLLKKTIPISKPRGEIANLLEVFYPKSRLIDMILDDSVEERLNRIIKEQRNFAKIRQHGLMPRRKVLLVGPPGTGKTMTASVLASELGLPLFQVRLDALITKYMGETAAKLRQIFESISTVRGIYFFDEFDAIGSQRGFINDTGEIRRVLNSFLQMIEQDNSNGVIIAATNHPEILDYALFRRFDDIVEYDLPNDLQIMNLLKSKLIDCEPNIHWQSLVSTAHGLSHAEITRAIEEAIKNFIIYDFKNIQEDDVKKALCERKKFYIHKPR